MDGCIGLSTQDSMRLYVDDKLLIDGWGKDKSADQALDFHFEAGRTYKIRIEFVNDRRGARVIFGYSAGRENFPAAVKLHAKRMSPSFAWATTRRPAARTLTAPT
ncbi:hypothetical protein LEA_10219 [human gut metagenome]|uniref:PA14 domain-containing protein n=1 Tax=human gut metagenome TaxID=408170 RepID=K1SYG5_9ZZZZ